MVVVRGPAAAGKSRTLLHAAWAHPVLQKATLYAPSPDPEGDDHLELFVGLSRGMHVDALKKLGGT
jgi:hypothetical protein